MRISEEGKTVTEHTLEDGMWSHNDEFDGLTGIIFIECFNCGFKKTYSKNRIPKWVKSKLIDATN